MAVWNILRPFGIFGSQLVYLIAIWLPFGIFGRQLVYLIAIW
jgi:hypothetical protein